MDYDKKRWVVLVVSCIVNIIIGTGYAWSVFAGPWAQELGIQNAAPAFTVCNAVGPVTMITGGKINDMLGPKWVVFVGGLMFGGGALLAGFSKSFGFLIFAYGIILGLGMGLVYSCTIGNTVKFFPDKRGMVGGLTTATYGLGSVILAPIARMMVENMGITSTFKVLGIVYLIVICVGRIPDHPMSGRICSGRLYASCTGTGTEESGRQDLVSDDQGSYFLCTFHHARMRRILRSDDDFPVFTGSTEYDRHGRCDSGDDRICSRVMQRGRPGALRIYLR